MRMNGRKHNQQNENANAIRINTSLAWMFRGDDGLGR
jgi:hypothetical protein